MVQVDYVVNGVVVEVEKEQPAKNKLVLAEYLAAMKKQKGGEKKND